MNLTEKTIKDLEDWFIRNNYKTTEDSLVLSCAWYRLRNNFNNKVNMPNSLFDYNLLDQILEVDRLLAYNIRDYFSKKIMVWKLKNMELTTFREDLNEFIHSDGLLIKEKMIGLIFRLPEFYHYDITIDEIFRYKNNVTEKK